MKQVSLIFYPDPRLRKVCKPVTTFNDDLRDLTAQMLEIMRSKNGIGLAGPQVGVMRRLFVCNVTGEQKDNMVLINPEPFDLVGAAEMDEGCLSIPGVNVPVRRAERCRIRAQDLDGNPIELPGEGLLARVWQHETDHLDGILILDKTTPTAKLAIRRTLQNLEADYRGAKTGSL